MANADDNFWMTSVEPDDRQMASDILKYGITENDVQTAYNNCIGLLGGNGCDFYFLSSGSACLQLVHRAINGRGYVPAYTCDTVYSSLNSLYHMGLSGLPYNLGFVESDLDHCLSVKKAIRYVLDTYLWGFMPGNSFRVRLKTLTSSRFYIADASQSLGITYKGLPVHKWASATVYSLGPTKALSTFTGGILIIYNNNLKKLVRNYINKESKNNKEPHILKKPYFPYGEIRFFEIILELIKNKGFHKNSLLELNIINNFIEHTHAHMYGYPPELFPLLENQLKKAEKIRTARMRAFLEWSGKYSTPVPFDEGSVYLTFPVFDDHLNKKDRKLAIDWFSERPISLKCLPTNKYLTP